MASRLHSHLTTLLASTSLLLLLIIQLAVAQKTSGTASGQEAVARRNDGVFYGLGGLDAGLFDLDAFFEQAAPTRTAALTTRAASTSRPRTSGQRTTAASTTSATRTSPAGRSRAAPIVADDGAFFDEDDELGPNGGNFPQRQREISPATPVTSASRQRSSDDDSDFRSPVTVNRGPPARSASSSTASPAARDGGRPSAFSRSSVDELRDDPRHQRQSFRGQSPNGHASFTNDDREEILERQFDGPARQPQPGRFNNFDQPPQRPIDRPQPIRRPQESSDDFHQPQSPSSQFLGSGGIFRPALTQQPTPFRPSLSSGSQPQTFAAASPETRRPSSDRHAGNFERNQFDTQRPNAEDDSSFQPPSSPSSSGHNDEDTSNQRRPFTGQSFQGRPVQQRPFFPSQDQRPPFRQSSSALDSSHTSTDRSRTPFFSQDDANDRPSTERRPHPNEQTQQDRPQPSQFDFGTGSANDGNSRHPQDDFFDGPSQGPPPQDVDIEDNRDFRGESNERLPADSQQAHQRPLSGSHHLSNERPVSDERPHSSERPASQEGPFFFDSGSQEDPQLFDDPTTSFQSQETPSDEIVDSRHTTEEAPQDQRQPHSQSTNFRPPQAANNQPPSPLTFRPSIASRPQPSIAASSAFSNSDPSQQAVHETIHRFPSSLPNDDLQREQLHNRFIDSLTHNQKQRHQQQIVQPHPDNFRSHQRPVATGSTVSPVNIFRGTPSSLIRTQNQNNIFRPENSFRPQQHVQHATPSSSIESNPTFLRPSQHQVQDDDQSQRQSSSSRGVTPHFFQQANVAESTGQLSPSFVRATEPTNFDVLERRPSSTARFVPSSPTSNVHHQSRSSLVSSPISDFLPTSATVRSQSPLLPSSTDKDIPHRKLPSTVSSESGSTVRGRPQPGRADGGRSIQSSSQIQDDAEGEEDFQLPHQLNAGLVSKFHGATRSRDHVSADDGDDFHNFRRPSSSDATSSQQIDPDAFRTSSTHKRLPATEADRSLTGRRGGATKRGRPSSLIRTTATQFATENTIDDVQLDPVPSRVRGGGHSSFSGGRGGGGTVAVAGQVATTCHTDTCQLPKCFCGGNQVQPGNLEPEDIPQMIVLTFDDAVNDLNAALYNRLFYQERLNPNGCPMLSTFYVSHEWTDYAKVQNLYAKGHEIASHSISHLDGRDFSKKKWYNEIYGQKEIMSVYGGVQLDDVKGMRSPFLAMGGDKQFSMLYETNFTYDTSMTVTDVHPPYWPYTLDHAIPHRCAIPPCPKLSYPGFWEIPMVALTDLNGGKCSMADSCSFSTTEEGIYEMLMKNFERHYKSNRAPFGLYYHASWFLIPHRQEGFVKFLEEIMKKDDVYLVTALQMLEWVKNPTPLSQIKNFAPWQCANKKPPSPPCSRPSSCELRFKGDVRYMSTCHACPDKYPWVGDTGVTKHAHTISA